MTSAYFEDHPTDPDKVISRKPKHDFGEPWAPVSIGVDMTEAGAHVVGIYAMTDDTSQIFYAKYYPAPQRTWVGLTDEEAQQTFARHNCTISTHLAGILARAIEAKLKEKTHDNQNFIL